MTNAPTKDWAEALLDNLAEEFADMEGGQPATAEHFKPTLRARLLPLLRAGQAMWDVVDSNGELGRTEEWEAWDAAVKAALGEK